MTFLGALALHVLFNVGVIEDIVQALGRETLLPVHVYVLLLAAIEVADPRSRDRRHGRRRLLAAARRGAGRHGGRLPARARPRRAAGRRPPPSRGIPLLLAMTIVGLPLAIWYLGRTAVALPACVIENLDTRAALGRSKHIVGRHFWRVSALTVLTLGVACSPARSSAPSSCSERSFRSCSQT